MAKPKDPTITIEIEGDPEDAGGGIWYRDFVQKVTQLLDALLASETLLPDEKRERVEYRLAALRKDSPATVSVMPIAQKRETRRAIVETFQSALRAASEPHPFGDVARAFQQELRPIAELIPTSDSHIRKMTVRVRGIRSKKIVLFPQHPEWLSTPARTIAEEAVFSFGSIAGRLERLDVHHDANKFTLWPQIGPRVAGTFGNSVKEAVERGFDRYVRVYGRLKYAPGDSYPREIDRVSEIDVYAPDENLPHLSDLRGIAPDPTDGMNIRDFIERLHGDE